jgi:O-antigen/teichoic acid export membrane protein
MLLRGRQLSKLMLTTSRKFSNMTLHMQLRDIASPSHPEKLGVLVPEQSSRGSILSAIKSLSWLRARQVGLSVADQALSVGGMFLVNVALARTQSKEDYGVFALSYSVFTFLSALYNAAILETYTVYGSGRYQKHYSAYAGLLWHSSILLGLGLTVVLPLLWYVLPWTSPVMASRTILGMGLTCGIPLTASFVRRSFYIRRRPDLAAKFSLIFFAVCAALLWLSIRAGILDGFYAFVITALAWIVAGVFFLGELPSKSASQGFSELAPAYWSEHWKYSRWVLVTAFVFQLTTQGYFWVTAGFLSVKEVGNLRAVYNVVLPLDQLFAAMSLVVLPTMCSRYASQRMAGLLPVWKAYCSGWLLVSCSFAGVICFFGQPVMHMLYGGKFDNVSSLVRTLAFLPVVMGIGHTVNGALKATEKPNLVFYAYFFSGGVTFLVGIPLVIHFGLRGAIYGMLLSGIAYTVALVAGFSSIAYSRIHRSAPDTSAG